METKTEKYKDYKSFTPMRCMACDTIIDNDIHDSLCEDCLSEVGIIEDSWGEDFKEYTKN